MSGPAALIDWPGWLQATDVKWLLRGLIVERRFLKSDCDCRNYKTKWCVAGILQNVGDSEGGPQGTAGHRLSDAQILRSLQGAKSYPATGRRPTLFKQPRTSAILVCHPSLRGPHRLRTARKSKDARRRLRRCIAVHRTDNRQVERVIELHAD